MAEGKVDAPFDAYTSCKQLWVPRCGAVPHPAGVVGLTRCDELRQLGPVEMVLTYRPALLGTVVAGEFRRNDLPSRGTSENDVHASIVP
jgi:hypothetical protein